MTTTIQTTPEVTTEIIIPTARPAGLGDQCQEYMRNPLFIGCDQQIFPDAPLLVRCKSQANRRLVLKNGDDVYAVKFCQWHHQLLKTRIETGISLVEILEDQEIEAHR